MNAPSAFAGHVLKIPVAVWVPALSTPRYPRSAPPPPKLDCTFIDALASAALYMELVVPAVAKADPVMS
jgi:hypothetical protein